MAEEAEPAAATEKCCAARIPEKCYDIRGMMDRYTYLPTKAGSELGEGKHVCRYGKCMAKGGHVAASRAKPKAAPAPAAAPARRTSDAPDAVLRERERALVNLRAARKEWLQAAVLVRWADQMSFEMVG